MGVHLPFGMNRAVGRLLMKTHRIGERDIEQTVVAPRQFDSASASAVLSSACISSKPPMRGAAGSSSRMARSPRRARARRNAGSRTRCARRA